MELKKTETIIIGGGLTGLTLAHELSRTGKKVLVIEKENHVGGVIGTTKEKGFVFETGPNTGIIGNTEIVELFDNLKDKIEVETANSKAKARWIWKKGKWRALPSGLFTAIGTPLFTWNDKLRILAEPFRKPGNYPNETVADLVRRRMGKSYLDYAVDPFISGIYAGNPEQLVTRFALPKLYALEQNYGSFVRGAMKKRKEPKTELEERVSKEVFSIKGGLGELIKALQDRVGKENILTGCSELKVSPRENGGFEVSFSHKGRQSQQIISEQVVSTIGNNNFGKIFPFLAEKEKKNISNTNYAKVVQVITSYKKWEGLPLNAFGGLIPSIEKRNSLGILFPSSIFEGRAPKGGSILSIFLGGIKKPEIIEMSDKELEKTALSEVKEMLHSKQIPDVLKICRYPNAIPQYGENTEERLKAIESVQKNYPGLFLAGNICNGIGMADRIKQGKDIALKIEEKGR